MRALHGFWPLFLGALRRDRLRISLWLIGILAFTLYCTQALKLAVPKEVDLTAMATLMRGAAGVVLVGPGYGFEHPTYANVFVGAYGLYVMVLAACMSILLAVRHTRQGEEAGTQELTKAFPVGRATTLAVASAVLCVANGGAAVLVWVGAAIAFAPGPSLLFACGVGCTGLMFGAMTLVCAQFVEHARTATGLGFLVLGLTFTVRGVGDVLGQPGTATEKGSALSWFSPLAWPQQTRAFVDDRWWPLALVSRGRSSPLGLRQRCRRTETSARGSFRCARDPRVPEPFCGEPEAWPYGCSGRASWAGQRQR